MSNIGDVGLWIVAIGAPVLAIFLFFKLFEEKKAAEEAAERDCITLTIMVPKLNDKTPLAAEQMFASLHGILRPGDSSEHLSFEIASERNSTRFYVHVPRHLKDFIEGQIYAQYPTVEIKEVEDYVDELPEVAQIVATELTLSKESVYPIKTFQNFEVDPLAGITGVLSRVDGNERIWVQIVVRPADDSWHKRGIEVVKATKAGLPLSGSVWEDFKNTVKDIGKEIPKAMTQVAIPPKEGKKEEKKDEKKLSGPVEAAMSAIEAKIQKLGFEVGIRILAAADTEDIAKSKLLAAVGAFKQFSTINLNGFVAGNLVTDHDILKAFKMRPFGKAGNIFNIEELASIYHFPHVTVATPSIVWAGSKKGEPPSNLPIEGKIPSEELTVFAETNFRSYMYKFGLKRNDRRLHTYVIGKTGTGKSNLLKTMIIDDIREGRGVAVVDPHGDLIKGVLNFIPEERIKEVVYINPADQEYPIGFNLLENVDPEQKTILASGLMSVFTKIWAGVWSARMEYILRNSILALLEYPNATFLGIMKLLGDKNYRKMVLDYVKDPVIRDFFINEYEKYDPKFRTEAIAPIQNKVGQFLSSTIIRNMVGQSKSTINMSEVMDTGKILLIDLTTGRIGEDNSALLGAMMITKIQLAAMQRADTPEDERRDFYLYVDEFQNFATDSFAVILSEARKYHLNLILTNQYIAQMPEVVSSAIFGNVGTLISFRVGATDASSLVKELEPVFDANDLVNLPNYQIYIKMAIDGVTCPAFSATTLPPTKETHDFRTQVIDWSRRTYGKPRNEVEAEIAQSGVDVEEILGSATGMAKDLVMGEVITDKETGESFSEIKDNDGKIWYETPGDTKEEIEESPKVVEKTDVQIEVNEKEDEDEGQQVHEGEEPQEASQDSGTSHTEHQHLITQEEAHEVAKSTFDNGGQDDNRGATSQKQGSSDRGETVVIEEGELVDVSHKKEE